MARNRMIRPEFWEDSKIASLTPYARLFFIALWNFADDEGYIENDILWLKAKCFPYDNIKIEKLVNELLNKNRIALQNNVILIINFLKYQRIEKPKKSDLKDSFGEWSGNSRGIVGEASATKDKLRQVKLRQVKLREDILSDLNSILKTSYKSTSSKTQELINARIKEGFSLDDFKIVHRKMAKAWGLDNKMRPYLRPQTLYSNKFESYLNRPEEIKEMTSTQQGNIKGLLELKKELKNDKPSI